MLVTLIRGGNIYNETPFGFREGRGIIVAIYKLKDDIQNWIDKKELEPSRKVYLIFLYSKAVFDYVDKEELTETIREVGIKNNFILRVMSL